MPYLISIEISKIEVHKGVTTFKVRDMNQYKSDCAKDAKCNKG